MFSQSVIEQLGCYVYFLRDPGNSEVFYVGKGTGNRVFEHVACALTDATESEKLDRIRAIEKTGLSVEHFVLRHGLSGLDSLAVESAIIDFCNFIKLPIANVVLGHGSTTYGLMTSNEIIRKYEAEPLSEIDSECVIININKTYQRAKGTKSYYEATKESWAINKNKISELKFVLAEFKGFIVEVFAAQDWYEVNAVVEKSGKQRIRWGFNGIVAESEVRDKYLNKSITKTAGASNPIRYRA